MTHAYTQIFIQYIITVKGKENLIQKKHNQNLQKYIREFVEKKDSVVLAINNSTDHMHILIRLNPKYSVAKIIRDIKSLSSKVINENKWAKGNFQWQQGYAAFSYSKSHIENVIMYINNQQLYHQQRRFSEEMYVILDKYQIEYQGKSIFEFYD